MVAMTSTPEMVDAVIARIRGVYGGWRRHTPIEQMRADWDRFLWSEAQPADWQDVIVGGVSARWITAPGANARRSLIWFHGGGYKMGSVVSHHELMARISAAAGCRVLGVNYRLMPEHRFPAPVEDALTVYRALLETGQQPAQLAMGGDSAGGGLVAAAMIMLRDDGIDLPASGVLLSALTDFATTGASYETRAAVDPIHQRALIQALARDYLAGADARDPRASPLHGGLHGLPPLLLQVGDRETGLDDSVAFAARARGHGVDVALEVWDGMIHVFQQFPAELPEARAAIARIGNFLASRWSLR